MAILVGERSGRNEIPGEEAASHCLLERMREASQHLLNLTRRGLCLLALYTSPVEKDL